jgi:hypothetical protein
VPWGKALAGVALGLWLGPPTQDGEGPPRSTPDDARDALPWIEVSHDAPPRSPDDARAQASDGRGSRAGTAPPVCDVACDDGVDPGRQDAPDDDDPQALRVDLRGRVGRIGSRDGVPSAMVLRLDGRGSAETDATGAFALPLPPGKHALAVRADGYDELRFDVEIVTDRPPKALDLRLRRSLDGGRFRTVVTPPREPAASPLTLREQEIKQIPGGQGDPFRVVSSLPGVSPVAGFLPYVVVRGAAPGNTATMLDGVRVPLLFHVAAGPAVIHPSFIDIVDFYPSGAPVRLGRFASGVIEGRTRPGRRDRVRGEIDVRLTDAGGMLEIPLSRRVLRGCTTKRWRDCTRRPARGSLAMAGRYSYTGLVLSLIPALNVKLQFWDYQLRLDHDIGRRSTYRAFVYGAYDSFGPRDTGGDSTAPEEGEDTQDTSDAPFARFQFHRVVQRLTTRLRDDGAVMVQLATGWEKSGAVALDSGLWRIAPRVELDRPLRPGLRLGIGLDQELQFFTASDPATIQSDFDAEAVGAFLSERFVNATGLWADLRFTRGLVELRPGVRLDVYTQVGRSPYLFDARAVTSAVGIDPRLIAREQVHPRWALRQSIGVYHQPPDSPIPLPGIESFGFERGLQRNLQGTVGYEYRLGKVATLTQDAFAGRLTNLLDYELAESSDDPQNEIEDFLVDVDGWTYGLETMLKLDPQPRLFGWAAYTLSRSIREYRLGGTAPSTWDQSHILNVVLGWKISRKWTVGGRIHFHTGRPYTPAVAGSTFESFARARNSRRLPPYAQFDFRIERTWLRKNVEVNLYLDVTNATLATEIFRCAGAESGDTADEIDAKTSRSIAGCVEPQGLPYILPALGLRVVL